MDRESSIAMMRDLMKLLVRKGGSDLFISAGFPPAIKVDGKIAAASKENLSSDDSRNLVYAVMNDRQLKEYEATQESNFALSPEKVGRFRVSAFVQRGQCGLVMRSIQTRIPNLKELNLPSTLNRIAMSRRGLVILVGGTGTGKSTTLASMINYRNHNSMDHIITLEDPIEYVYENKRSLIMQREIGLDTNNWGVALKNSLRQAPDVILIGEIRDAETMGYGITFADTGHLAMATLHANSTNQAFDRIINFFDEERREQLLMDIASNLRAVVSQRLIPRKNGKGRLPAVEILLNTELIAHLIRDGKLHEIKQVIKRSRELGMCSFDQSLFELHQKSAISFENALKFADSVNEVRLRIKLEGNAAEKTNLLDEVDHLNLDKSIIRGGSGGNLR